MTKASQDHKQNSIEIKFKSTLAHTHTHTQTGVMTTPSFEPWMDTRVSGGTETPVKGLSAERALRPKRKKRDFLRMFERM